METLDGVRYELFDYFSYRERLKKLLCDESLLELGVARQVLGKSTYGYDIDCITIGNGNKHLFVVGGTHGCEMISVDFVTQFIGEVKNFIHFDPNEFKLFIIPLQNPEGFVISTDSLSVVKNDFHNQSYEYYLRYKIDNIIVRGIRDFNKFVKEINEDSFNVSMYLDKFKKFLNTNFWWKKLKEVVPGIDQFIFKVNHLENIDNYVYLKEFLISICNDILFDVDNVNNEILMQIMSSLRNYFANSNLWDIIDDKSFIRFHQAMFKNVSFDNISNQFLSTNVRNMYNTYGHPLGSQVTFYATGIGINLNANHKLNPGINAIKNGKDVFGGGARNNIHNYVPGPLGVPCRDVYHFEYAVENKVLYDLIKSSYDSGNYIGTLLYHGTGGIIYYKPYNDLMRDERYRYFNTYNKNMASIYEINTGYSLVNNSDTTGYGDLLRRTFPGVLMIELSKMGGNPIAPYGDKNNIYYTFKDNYSAIDSLLGYFHQLGREDNEDRKRVK